MIDQSTFEKIVGAFALIMALTLYGIVSEMDYQDALAQEQHYKEMVCDGHWPDYKELRLPCD
jgi:hypothetical protein